MSIVTESKPQTQPKNKDRHSKHNKKPVNPKQTKQKLDLSGVVPKDAPKEAPKAEKKEDKHKPIVAKYLSIVKSRHSSLPANVLEILGKAATKGQAKRLLKAHLQGKRIDVV